MAKTVKSNKWFVRIDGCEEYLRDKVTVFSRQIDIINMLCYFHTGSKKENPHCHMVVEMGTVLQKQSFAVRLKNIFTSIVKKSDYAVTPWDGNREMGAVSYMFHETDAIQLVNKGFSDEELELASKANDAVQKVVAINKEKASNKLVDEAVSYYQGMDSVPSKERILGHMLKRIKDGSNYYPGSFLLKKYVEEVELALTPEVDIPAMAYDMARKMWG